MKTLDLQFEYSLPRDTVHNWWTDLSGKGYVGKALKELRPIGQDGESTLVQTKWKIMGMTKTLVERLSIPSPDHWVWEPQMFRISMKDDFRITDSRNGETVLHIHSEMRPQGLLGKLANFILGSYLERMIVEEWKSASEAFKAETSSEPL